MTSDPHSENPLPEWPEHFPADCPPGDAQPADGVVYLAAHDPPTAEDWKSAQERGHYLKLPQCRRVSLSCFRSAEQLEFVLRMPQHHGKVVHRAELGPEHGVLKLTEPPPNHLSLWLKRTWCARAGELFFVAGGEP